MTAVGGIGHTLPFLIANFTIALAAAALVVVYRAFSDLNPILFT